MCKIRFANTRYCSPLWAYLMTVIITTSVNQQFSAVQFRRASTYTFDGEKVDRKVVGNVYIETSATAIDHSSLLVCCLRRELVQSSASLSVCGRDRTFHPLDTCSPPIVAGIHTVAQKPDPPTNCFNNSNNRWPVSVYFVQKIFKESPMCAFVVCEFR